MDVYVRKCVDPYTPTGPFIYGSQHTHVLKLGIFAHVSQINHLRRIHLFVENSDQR